VRLAVVINHNAPFEEGLTDKVPFFFFLAETKTKFHLLLSSKISNGREELISSDLRIKLIILYPNTSCEEGHTSLDKNA
jgi:hypothetical protein